jgi:hypothetical protein
VETTPSRKLDALGKIGKCKAVLTQEKRKNLTTTGLFPPKISDGSLIFSASSPGFFQKSKNIMLGKLAIAGVVAVCLLSATGCTMCCHPYDNCGPVYDEASGRSYCDQSRAGSILEGATTKPPAAATEEIIEEAPQQVSAAAKPQPATDLEPRRLPTTDRKAVQTATTPRSASPKTNATRRVIKQAGDPANSSLWRW